MIFGCRHLRISWPRTPRGGVRLDATVQCFDCGKTLTYDWLAMKILEPGERQPRPVAGKKVTA